MVLKFQERLDQQAPNKPAQNKRTQVHFKMLLSSPQLRPNALQGLAGRRGPQPVSTQRRFLEVHAAAKVDAAPAKVSEQAIW